MAKLGEYLMSHGERLRIVNHSKFIEHIYDIKVLTRGFDKLTVFQFGLNNLRDVRRLVPDFTYDVTNYHPIEAVCFLDADKPVFALIDGKTTRDIPSRKRAQESFEHKETPLTTFANLLVDQTQMDFGSSSLARDGKGPWPGYSFEKSFWGLTQGEHVLVVNKESGIYKVFIVHRQYLS